MEVERDWSVMVMQLGWAKYPTNPLGLDPKNHLKLTCNGRFLLLVGWWLVMKIRFQQGLSWLSGLGFHKPISTNLTKICCLVWWWDARSCITDHYYPAITLINRLITVSISVVWQSWCGWLVVGVIRSRHLSVWPWKSGNRIGKLYLTCNEHGYGWDTAIDVFDTWPRIFNSDALGQHDTLMIQLG